MVMKRNAMLTNLRQSILRSLGRYIAIAMIIALGAAIFVGLRMTKADMVATGQVYTDKQNMFDLRLITSYGWNRDHPEQVRQLEGVADAEGVFYTDLIAHQGEGEDSVYRFYTLPERINRLVLLGGRMPEAPNECLADGYRVREDILGTQVTVSELNSQDSLDILNEKVYTIVGYVSTPLYMDMNRGTTSVGSGSLTNYFFVPENAFDVDYFTEIHVTVPGDYAIYSKEYNDAMDAKAEQLEALVQPIAEDRLNTVATDAEQAYSEGYAEYMDGLMEYYEGFHTAHEELREGYERLRDGQQELADSEQLLTDGEQQIADARLALKEGKKTLEESKKTLATTKAAAYKQISQSTQDMMKELQSITEDQQLVDGELLEINSRILKLEAEILPLETDLTMVESEISQIRSMIGVLDLGIEAAQGALDLAIQNGTADEQTLARLQENLDSQKNKKAQYEAQIGEKEAEKAAITEQLAPLYAQHDQLEAEKAQLQASSDSLGDTISQLMTSMMELVVTQSVMDKEFAAADAQIEAAQAQMEAGELELDIQAEKLAEGWIQLEEGRRELEEGWKEYYQGSVKAKTELLNAKQQLADGRAELADARQTIDSMTEITPMVLDRNSNIGYGSLDSSSDIVAGVSRVMPAFFLLVAALVCITTMTRMVDEERTQIGTLKALGYSNPAIMSKYLLYAGTSAVLGCGLGVFAGSAIFPAILWEAYKIMLFIQDSIVLTFDIGLCLLVVGVYTAVELFVTWYSCRRALQEVPAELIRPKAPDAGKPLIFERLPIWQRVSFLNKVTIRNIFRYRQRLAMMMVGIGGCTALLVTGFGLRDSIVNVVDYQFQEVTTYDLQVYFDNGCTEEDRKDFLQEASTYADLTIFYHQSSVELEFENAYKELYMISADQQVQQVIDFHTGQEPLSMPGKDEVLLSVGVAEALGIRVGDTVAIRNADMQQLDLTVSGIYDNHVENYAIVLPETIAGQWGALPEQQMALLKLQQDQDPHVTAAALSELDKVMNVSVSADLADMVSRMMDALDLVVVVVVVCAALLAFTVLYNLTNININERIREIATIKVLGFNASETAAYVFKENMTLTVVGSILGLALGNLLLSFVMSQVKIDMVWFKALVMPISYIWSVLLTILSAVIVNFVFFFKLDTINMAEALKSVE